MAGPLAPSSLTGTGAVSSDSGAAEQLQNSAPDRQQVPSGAINSAKLLLPSALSSSLGKTLKQANTAVPTLSAQDQSKAQALLDSNRSRYVFSSGVTETEQNSDADTSAAAPGDGEPKQPLIPGNGGVLNRASAPVVSDIELRFNQYGEPLQPGLLSGTKNTLLAFQPSPLPSLPYASFRSYIVPFTRAAGGGSAPSSFGGTMTRIGINGLQIGILQIQVNKAQVTERLVTERLWDSLTPRAQNYLLDEIKRGMQSMPNGFGGGVGTEDQEQIVRKAIDVAKLMSHEDLAAKPQPTPPTQAENKPPPQQKPSMETKPAIEPLPPPNNTALADVSFKPTTDPAVEKAQRNFTAALTEARGTNQNFVAQQRRYEAAYSKVQDLIKEFYWLAAGGRAAAPKLQQKLGEIDAAVKTLRSIYTASNAPVASLKAVHERISGIMSGKGSEGLPIETIDASSNVFRWYLDGNSWRTQVSFRIDDMAKWKEGAQSYVSGLKTSSSAWLPAAPIYADKGVAQAENAAQQAIERQRNTPPTSTVQSTPEPQETDIERDWRELGEGSEAGGAIVREAERAGKSPQEVLDYIRQHPDKTLREVLADLQDGRLGRGGLPPNNPPTGTVVAGAGDDADALIARLREQLQQLDPELRTLITHRLSESGLDRSGYAAIDVLRFMEANRLSLNANGVQAAISRMSNPGIYDQVQRPLLPLQSVQPFFESRPNSLVNLPSSPHAHQQLSEWLLQNPGRVAKVTVYDELPDAGVRTPMAEGQLFARDGQLIWREADGSEMEVPPAAEGGLDALFGDPIRELVFRFLPESGQTASTTPPWLSRQIPIETFGQLLFQSAPSRARAEYLQELIARGPEFVEQFMRARMSPDYTRIADAALMTHLEQGDIRVDLSEPAWNLRDDRPFTAEQLVIRPLTPQTQANGFVIGGRNSNAQIAATDSINGIPIAELEQFMRPSGTIGSSFTGFLARNESLLQRLLTDNATVTDAGFTHQQLARPLKLATEMALSHPMQVFRWNGELYMARAIRYMGAQDSPFGRNADGSNSQAWHDIDVINLRTGEHLRFSQLLPQMIDRYGFYEGDVPYRLPPEDIMRFFRLQN